MLALSEQAAGNLTLNPDVLASDVHDFLGAAQAGDHAAALASYRGPFLDGVAFAGVAQYPARVKCALLGWAALTPACSA